MRARSARTRSAGSNRSRGLNENLAREILELHTLGVRSVYTQDDVTSFAKVITGWTVVPPRQDPERGGEFVFNPRMHEPGPQTVIGKSYPDSRRRAGPRRARRSRAPSGDREACRAQARAPFRRRRAAAGAGRAAGASASSTPTATSRRSPRRWSTAPEAWDAPRAQAQASGRMDRRRAARDRRRRRPTIRPLMQAHNLLGEPLWRPPAPKAFPTTTRPGSTAWRSASTSPTSSRAASPARVDPMAVFEDDARRRSRRPRRGRPSRAPRAGRRRWRCC